MNEFNVGTTLDGQMSPYFPLAFSDQVWERRGTVIMPLYAAAAATARCRPRNYQLQPRRYFVQFVGKQPDLS